ncbi:high-temperature-induced dauer-formation protein-domain-containing protein [Suillus bovinus]|uniref:high-temperature-induced dauer-formation protein-domain-containing protein n=1 Tax=Suillus bovinus TaxID=48563 RepID=UPI001B86FEEF|nr:high-temperature-induced dauer-formation protein-domain-containing protein [Suillus bovinus]KAG2146949.1 high-temperature-induced dauer-formation protein-domain-containing protein [Suillus bovinus]
MFAKLPQTLTAPFGLLTDEAKLAFRSRPQGISKLYTTRHIAETDSYWGQYFTLFDTPSDVFSLISTHDVRRALLDSPENVATLIRVVTSRLFNLVSDHTFPSAPPASVASYATSFMKTSSAERNATKEVLNSLRVLQRVLPVVFEVEGESNTFELEVLWKKVEVDDDEIVPATPEQAPQFVIEDDDDGSESGHLSNAQSQIPQPKRTKTLPSLGEKLFTCINDLLFCCGFSLPMKIQVDHYKINYVIWEKGVGSTTDSGPNHAYDSNKTEVLRLLLVLLSRQIYIPPAALFTHPSFYTLHVVRKTPRRDVLTLLCSLLNTVMNSATTNNMTIAGVAGKVPYNHLVFKGEDSRTALVGMCLQVLCVLLDFQSGPARDIASDSGDATSSPTAQTNAFRYFLAKLHRTQDFAFILSGIIAILEQQLAISNNLLPGSRKSVPYVPETIVLFWKIVELNKKFRAYLLDSDKTVDVLAYLLCYSLEIKDKPQQHGLCRALSYIIQTLSAEPAFGNKLSSQINIQIPTKWASQGASHGTAGDFMINAPSILYPALIIALANAAPYFKNLSVVASNRLLQLFTSFSNPLFLLSDESHPRLSFLMLEVFNSVVFHHLSDNPNLLYAIITAQKTFEELGTFTLARGLREIQRVQRIKEEQASQAERDRKNGSQQDRVSVESAHQEKLRLLKNESDPAFTIESTSFSGEDLEAGLGGHEQTETRPLTSPPSENSPTTSTSTITAASEKARGKMKARRSLSTDTVNGDRMAAAGVGRNGFLPTQEWVTSWQQGLPLDTVMLVISELLPKIQNLQAGWQKANSAGAITDFLQSVTLTDVLPPAPVLYPRRFVWSDASIVWLTSLIWGGVYVHGMSPLGIWNSTNVRLFFVKHAQPQQQRQITDTMSSVVGGLFSPTRQRLERSSNQ